jgi:hypothetical protein
MDHYVDKACQHFVFNQYRCYTDTGIVGNDTEKEHSISGELNQRQ